MNSISNEQLVAKLKQVENEMEPLGPSGAKLKSMKLLEIDEEDHIHAFISVLTSNWKEVSKENSMLERRLRERINGLEESIEGEPSIEVQNRIHSLNKELDDWVAYYHWVERLVEFFESGEIFTILPFKETTLKHNQGGIHS
ncbi:hypothetical protein [Alkalicoccobacillus porphyridii]|uniref:Uncharacterized protein n=1 Tax=Alkalicoccobacillus porphyridii TaxID=2597270 RepID=A0A554A1A6_9BACI|nr:hypothetical protein [Alkalicoccobacillus porphyridii]TSB47473.1 hypothetical protein FN960_06985 [Alkalicoccobacillus porphyridii]